MLRGAACHIDPHDSAGPGADRTRARSHPAKVARRRAGGLAAARPVRRAIAGCPVARLRPEIGLHGAWDGKAVTTRTDGDPYRADRAHPAQGPAACRTPGRMGARRARAGSATGRRAPGFIQMANRAGRARRLLRRMCPPWARPGNRTGPAVARPAREHPGHRGAGPPWPAATAARPDHHRGCGARDGSIGLTERLATAGNEPSVGCSSCPTVAAAEADRLRHAAGGHLGGVMLDRTSFGRRLVRLGPSNIKPRPRARRACCRTPGRLDGRDGHNVDRDADPAAPWGRAGGPRPRALQPIVGTRPQAGLPRVGEQPPSERASALADARAQADMKVARAPGDPTSTRGGMAVPSSFQASRIRPMRPISSSQMAASLRRLICASLPST